MSTMKQVEVRSGRRRGGNSISEQESERAAAPSARKPRVPRRRQIDPTTCERDYSRDELEFMRALDDYKRRSGRMFPTCSEILEVIRELGYVRLEEGEEELEDVEADSAVEVPGK